MPGIDAGLFDLFLIAASLFIGSFVTAAANAWPDWSKVGLSRSACSHCGRTLGPHELIPVLSYLIQRGRCRTCGTPIWPGHPIGETACLAVGWLAAAAGDTIAASALAALLGWTLVFASLVDIRTFLLPDAATLSLIPLGLIAAGLRGGPDLVMSAAIGAALGFSIFAAIAFVYKRLRGRDGLGMGDAKLLAAAGAWAGPFALPWIIAGGAMLTLAVLLAQRLRGGRLQADTAAPFGPGLAAAGFAAHLAVLTGIGPLSGALYSLP